MAVSKEMAITWALDCLQGRTMSVMYFDIPVRKIEFAERSILKSWKKLEVEDEIDCYREHGPNQFEYWDLAMVAKTAPRM